MFTLDLSPTFQAAVRGSLPGDVPVSFTATFRRLTRSEQRALEGESLNDADFVRRVLVGWGEDVLEAEGGPPLAFSAAALDRVLEVQGVAAAIVVSYYRALVGVAEKN